MLFVEGGSLQSLGTTYPCVALQRPSVRGHTRAGLHSLHCPCLARQACVHLSRFCPKAAALVFDGLEGALGAAVTSQRNGGRCGSPPPIEKRPHRLRLPRAG